MTSWIQVPRRLRSEDGPRVRNYFLRLEDGEFANYFVSLFNAYMFGAMNTRALYVYDKSNPVSASYALLNDTFETAEGITYVSEMMSGVTVLTGSSDPRYAGFLRQMDKNSLRSNANTILRWNSATVDSIMNIITSQNLPSSFDVGVHIRSRNRMDVIRPPTVAAYVSAVEDALRTQKVKEPSIFLLLSEPNDFSEFKNLAPKTWKLFQVLPSTTTIRGGNIGSFNRQSAAVKLNAYREHLAELFCMQQSTNIISTLANDVGRFLFLTSKTPDTFKSLDVQNYS